MSAQDTPPVLWFYLLSFALGGAVALSELVSRYKDAPLSASSTLPGLFYILLNGAGSVAALALVQRLRLLDGVGDGDAVSKLLIQSLAAGVSAMALFRSSLITIRVGNADVAVGPAAFLQILIQAADRACDRRRAGPRARAVQAIMQGIDFKKSSQALPSLCFGLMQNVSVAEQQAFGLVVGKLEAAQMEDVFKSNSLGLELMNVVGERVLRQAVGMLRADIALPPRPVVQSLDTLRLLRNVNIEACARQMIDSCIILASKMGDATLRGTLESEYARIRAMKVSDRQQVLLLSAMLIGTFGEAMVQTVLQSLPENDAPRSVNPSSRLLELLRQVDLARVTAEDVADICLFQSGRGGDEGVRDRLAGDLRRAGVLPVTDDLKQQMRVALLVSRFGEDIVATVLGGLPQRKIAFREIAPTGMAPLGSPPLGSPPLGRLPHPAPRHRMGKKPPTM